MHQGLKVLKLTSGDTIVGDCSTKKSSSIVQVNDPVQFTMMYRGGGGGTLVAQQWLETDEKSFSIHKMQIVAVAEPNDMLKAYYKDSLKDLSVIYEEDYSEIEDLINFDIPQNKTIH